MFLLPGARTISAYAQNFLPGQEVIQVDPGANELTLALEPGDPLGISGVTATALSAEEIAARGLGLDDPANSLVFDFELTTGIDVLVPNIVLPLDPTEGQVVNETLEVDDLNLEYTMLFPVAGDPYQRVEVWVITPGTVRMLKQFWDVAVSVTNQTSAFVIEDSGLQVNLPSGLSLPALFGGPQFSLQSFGDLDPGESANAEWVVRGDLPGTYLVGANASGTLRLGGLSIPLAGAAEGSVVKVEEPRIRVTAVPSVSEVLEGESFNLDVTVENLSPVPLNGVVIEMDPERIENAEIVVGETLRRVIGTIPANGQASVSFELIPVVPEEEALPEMQSVMSESEQFPEMLSQMSEPASTPRRFTIAIPPLPNQQTALTTRLGLTLSEIIPGIAFADWPILATLPPDKRGPLDRNGPLDLPNLLAYAMALDPLVATAADLPNVGTYDTETNTITFRYRRATVAPGTTLKPVVSTDLDDWQDADTTNLAVHENPDDWQQVELTLPAPPDGRLFLRLEAQQTP